MGRLFGTDGVRGIANKELTPELAFNLGKAGAHVLGKKVKRPLFIIGKDTRVSGDMFSNALSAGILAVGGDVIKVGVLPTPAIAYLVKHYKADAGVVISASHNTFEYNGIKFFNGKGFKLDDDIEDEIEDIILRDIDVNSHITGAELGKSLRTEGDALQQYTDFLISTVDYRLDGKKIVLDCANGAAYEVAEKVYTALGADVVVIGNAPDGLNINDGVGSTHPQKLQAAVKKHNAFIGLAYDGDADRLIAVDERGEIVDGDKIMCICGKMMMDAGELTKNKITVTVMSNLGFHRYASEYNWDVDVTDVGDRYVLEKMLETGCNVGGEQSGHMIFLNHTTTGDGVLSSLQLVRAVLASGKKLSELSDAIRIYPQVLVNAKLLEENKKKYSKDFEIQAEIKKIEKGLGNRGRVLIRPSGTEPVVRVMIEGEDINKISELAETLAKKITSKLDVKVKSRGEK
ncbi:MAG: phosphoglucosamine mutase [Anaerovoracaceae bacterium]